MRYVIGIDELAELRPNAHELARFAHGHLFGWDNSTLILTESLPGGGPVPHIHPVEEVHVLGAGQARYRVGDDTFDVEGPTIVRLPADVPHGFVNTGTGLLVMTCFLPTPKLETAFRPDLAETADTAQASEPAGR